MTSIIRHARSLPALLVLSLALLLGACASTGAGGGAEAGENEVVLQVNNNLIPPTSLTVWAVPEIGSRTLVGTVQPSTETTLTFNATGGSNSFNFVAETTSGQPIVSNPITAGPGDALQWQLQSNIVTVQ